MTTVALYAFLLFAAVAVNCSVTALERAMNEVNGDVEGETARAFATPAFIVVTQSFIFVVVATLCALVALGYLVVTVNFETFMYRLWGDVLFFLPALAANQGAGLARKLRLPLASWPVNTARLGPNKTWGAYYGIVLAAVVVWLQSMVPWLASPDILYDFETPLVVGLLMGVGAALGDHGESYVKRLRGVAPGDPWWPFDAFDFVIGAALVSALAYGPLALAHAAGFMFLMLALHPAGNYIGYLLGLRSRVL